MDNKYRKQFIQMNKLNKFATQPQVTSTYAGEFAGQAKY